MGTKNTVLRLIDGYIERENIVYNPSAEVNLDGWDINEGKGGGITRSNAAAYKGEYSVLFTSAGTDPGEGISFYAGPNRQKFKVHEETAYWWIIHALAKTAGDVKALLPRTAWYDKNGTLLHTSAVLPHSFALLSTSEWLDIVQADIAPTGAVEAVPYIRPFSDAHYCDYYADGVCFFEGPSGNMEYVDGDEPGCMWLDSPHAGRSVKGVVRQCVDFIDGDAFHLLKDGLELPAPEAIRLMGGDPLLSDRGQRLIDRKFNNREILVRFKVTGQSGEDLRRELVRLQSILDSAVRTSRIGLQGSVVLEWAGETIPEPVYFDIIDGDISYELSSTQFAREQIMLENQVTLIAKPYARAKHIIPLSNYIINSDFDCEFQEFGRDGAQYRTFGTSGDRLERANCNDIISTEGDKSFTVTAAIYVTDGIGTHRIIARAGNAEADATPLNRGAWELALNTSNKLVFTVYESDGTPISITGYFDMLQGVKYIVGATYYQRSGDLQFMLVTINGEIWGYVNSDYESIPTNYRETTGKFTVGADDQNGNRFVGRIQNLAVVRVPFTGVEHQHLCKAGTKSLTEHATPYTNCDFWNLGAEDWGASWPDFSGSPVEDVGPKGLDLTVVGTPAASINQRLPAGWTIGSSLDAASGSGLKEASDGIFSPRTGRFMFLFKKGTSDANCYIQQTVTVPDHKKYSGQNQWWTFVARVKAAIDDQKLSVHIDASVPAEDVIESGMTLDVVDGWRQFIIAFRLPTSTSFVVKLYQITPYGALNLAVDCVQVLEGTPFGYRIRDGVYYGSTAPPTPMPQITSRFHTRNENSAYGKMPYLTVRDIPGDQPAGCRLCIEHEGPVADTDRICPIRVGLLWGGEHSKFISNIHPGGFLSYAGYIAYDSVDYGQILRTVDTVEKETWYSVGIHPIGSIIAEPQVIRGAIKILAGLHRGPNSWYDDIYGIMKMKGPFGTVALTHNPTKAGFTNGYDSADRVDCGTFVWPPMPSIQSILNRSIQGRLRMNRHNQIIHPNETTRLDIQLAHNGSSNPTFLAVASLDIIPCEDGFFQLSASGESDIPSLSIFFGDILVINSIDNEGAPISIGRRQGAHTYQDHISPSIDAAGTSTHVGDTFHLMPAISNMFTIAVEVPFSGSPITGRKPSLTESEKVRAWIEYEARYLYV